MKMSKKNQLKKIVASATLALASVAPVIAQSNLGSACGCPPVSSRPTVLLSSLPGFSVVAGANGGELTSGATLTCQNTYIMDQKIYVPNGQTVFIEPGTVIKGRVAPTVTTSYTIGTTTIPAGAPDPSQAASFVVSRGGKVIANGTKDCQIVFTAEADPLDGTYPIANKGMWGGVVLLGKASNNLTLTPNGTFTAGGSGKLAAGDGLGVIEGFATSVPQDRFGVLQSGTVAGETVGTFNDDDNSGILRYVSIRHAGAILAVGSEINGLTLGSVGRGTTIENIEIVSCADDNIELFGGTVNLKYCSVLYGNDDMFDFDLGWSGKAQFLFGMKTDNTASADSDNGFEADSDDNKKYITTASSTVSDINNMMLSRPKIYNATIIGNEKTTGNSDNAGLSGIMAKELTAGEFYNSIFANFRNGFNMAKAIGTRTGSTSEAYHNWAGDTRGNGSQLLKVKCNAFVGCANPATTDAGKTTVGTALSGADLTQFTTTDMNTVYTGNTLPGFDYAFTVNNTTNVWSAKNDVVPNPALSTSGCPAVPADGFFTPAAFKGAFSSDPTQNWLSDWSYSSLIGTTKGLVSCPTDLNKDGQTNITDFLIFAPAFGYSCN